MAILLFYLDKNEIMHCYGTNNEKEGKKKLRSQGYKIVPDDCPKLSEEEMWEVFSKTELPKDILKQIKGE